MNYGKQTLAVLAALMLSAAPVAVHAADDTKDQKAPAAAKDAKKDGAKKEAAAKDVKKDGAKKEAAAKDVKKDAAKKAAAKPVEPKADLVMVTVNGKPITLGEVIAMRQNLPKQYQQYPDNFLMRALVDQMANQSALADAAIKSGVQNSKLAKALLASQRRAILADLYIRQQINARITEKAIKEAYDKAFAKATPVPEIRASHILVKTEELAKKLKKELDGGAKFADLAKKHGSDGSKTRGGDLGWFSQKRMVPAFGKAAFALKKNQISDPVKTRFGWHLILKTDERTRPVPTLKQVRSRLVQRMRGQLQRTILKEAAAAAKIEKTKLNVSPKAVRMDDLLKD